MFKPLNSNYLILILPKGFNVLPLLIRYNTISLDARKRHKFLKTNTLTYKGLEIPIEFSRIDQLGLI